MKERIDKLDKKIQEYIYIGYKAGIFNDDNIERVVSRLERVKFSIDNNNPGDAQTSPIRDEKDYTMSYGLDVKINEKRINAKGQYFFEDEVIFHELTHCINGIYENWFENLSLWSYFDKKFDEYFPGNQKKIESYSNNPEFRQKGYGWLVLDEFISQYISQKMVEAKYGKKIYFDKERIINETIPKIKINSNLNDYWEFTNVVKSFVKTIYGDCDLDSFCIEAIKPDIINTIFQTYQKKENGLECLYYLLGEMGNIGFAVSSRNFTPEQVASDKDMMARDPNRLYKYYNQCTSISNDFLNSRTVVPGVLGHFG